MESDRTQSPSDASESDAPYRRRGRPIGKNRVPLSLIRSKIYIMPCKGKENIPPTKSCGCIETTKPPNQPNHYRYYDTPDGCDIFKKVLVTSRYGAMAGLIISTYDVLMYSHAIGFGPIMRRYAYHTIPLTLMGATFAGVTNTVLCMRNEDDLWNYFIGGFSCGPILRTYLGTNHAVLLGGLALGIIAMIKKDSVTSGYQLFPHPPNHLWSVRKWRADYTLVPDPKDELIHTCGVDNEYLVRFRANITTMKNYVFV